MKQYEMNEFTFEGKIPEGSQAQVDVQAVFTCGEESVSVKGFYAGEGRYKVRFYPRQTGLYQWKVTGAVQAQGEEQCEASGAAHGIVKADGLHFKYEDGTRYQPIGTTIYALVHQEKELVDTTMKTLSEAPFNKVRFCVFPKSYDFNQNDPQFYAFEKTDGKFDVHKPCFAFWEELEMRIAQLGSMGIEGDLILFHPYDRWGFSEFDREECLVYLDYLERRLAAYPNLWWSLANEFDLMGHFKEEWWSEFAAFVASNDPYGHLLSNHNCFGYWDFNNEHTTHCCIQDTCVDDVPLLQKKYNKPVVFDECCYEGNIIHPWGNISAFEMVNRFWTAMVCGGYCTHGETYMDENDVLWWAKGGVLHGESPARIAFLREIMESLPGPVDSCLSGLSLISLEHLQAIKNAQEAGQELPEGMNNPFVARLLTMSDDRIKEFVSRHREILGHCGEDAYIRYYRRQCTSIGELNLPENGSYRVDVIDVWEMTRTPALQGVSGKVRVKLPGKEGIAVLAVRE